MSYQIAMEAAGAEVTAFQEFGSYQGDWFAKIKHNGETGWVHGTYGSCSGCDSFQAEFSCDDDDYGCAEQNHEYNKQPDCPTCQARSERYQQRLANFGSGYLTSLMTQDEAENIAKDNWDDEDGAEQLEFLRNNTINPN